MAEGEGILALDVGGSHISAGLFNPHAAKPHAEGLCSGTLGDVGHVLIPAGGGVAFAVEFLNSFEALCRRIVPLPAAVSALAIALPNPFDYERGISYMKHKFQGLYGVDLRPALAERLGCDPGRIYFLNDAAAFLIGELRQGAAIGVDRAVGITLGTGIGSAFAVGGCPVIGGRGVPAGGEIWNLPYRGGIAEDWAGTAAIQRLYRDVIGEQGDVAKVHEIAAAAASGEPKSRETFERFGGELGRLLRLAVAGFAPQRIIVGGGIARSAELFFPAAQAEIADLGIELRVSLLGDRAPLVGAALSWLERPGAVAAEVAFETAGSEG